MRYRLGVEDIEPGHWVAWALELPGCFSPGSTRTEAIANAGASIAAYEHWLAMHEGRDPVDNPYMDIHVAEICQSIQTAPDYTANAFFEDDRRALSKEDIQRVLKLLEFTRADLMAAVDKISKERRAAPIPGEADESIDGILNHVGASEWWYLDRLELAFPRAELPDDPVERLKKTRGCLRAKLPDMAGVGLITTRQGETWSARKVARRALWHEKDHTQHIVKLAGV